MKKEAFDNNKYLKIQRESILKRISKFGDKLYLEFGGKLFDDYHASRVLPGFKPDSKLQMLLGIKERVEMVVVVNANDIISNKVRNDTLITYQEEVERLIDTYKEVGLYVSSVVISFYVDNASIKTFINKLKRNDIKVYKHYKINGYPQDIPLIVSKDGLGKNEYIQTSKPLVVVTAPGPGSGKMATCLSQLYHDHKNGINAGYAKYETFPVWNLSLNHPVNLAYEAATIDLNDINMIDPFHLEKYGVPAVNYNRDVEVFPLLKNIFEQIYGESPYYSPTDMGVNMVGFAISDDKKVAEACYNEIIRRYYQTKKNVYLGRLNEDSIEKMEILMNKAGVKISDRKVIEAALEDAKKENEPAVALELPNGKIVVGHRSELFGACAACLLNALKTLGKIDKKMFLLMPMVIEPLKEMKIKYLHRSNSRLRAEEVLLALSIQSKTNPLADQALKQLPKLVGCEAHSSTLLSEVDLSTLSRLGIRVTEEPISYKKKLYTKNS
ncbi:MAG: DUF1846 domain-containing protein [Bacilli bacterium]|nr:DUF1846 domain-containing protein [Bacilli bacterium]